MLTLIRCSFHPRVTTVARKRPRSLCQMYRCQVTPKHACTLDPTKLEWVHGSLQGNQLKRNWSRNARPQSSRFAEPLWTDPRLKSRTSARELTSIKKSDGEDWFVEPSSKSSRTRETPPPTKMYTQPTVGMAFFF